MERRHFIAELHKNNGRTKAVFTEAVEVQGSLKNKIAGFYLRKQQKRYVNDMKKALGEV